MHIEVRKRVHKKFRIFNQNYVKLLLIEMYKKEKTWFIFYFKISYEQSSFHIEMGSSPLPRKFHEEHNDTH